jgi:hypothetical protein
MIPNCRVSPRVTGSAARRRSRIGESGVTTLAPAPLMVMISEDGNTPDWSRQPAAGWSEFRVRRAIFLASLTLQAASGGPERPGGDSPSCEGPPVG